MDESRGRQRPMGLQAMEGNPASHPELDSRKEAPRHSAMLAGGNLLHDYARS